MYLTCSLVLYMHKLHFLMMMHTSIWYVSSCISFSLVIAQKMPKHVDNNM